MTTLIGTNPDQIPVNSMLGGMAYQDPDNVSVGKITYSGTLLGNGDVVFGGSSTIWTSTGRTSLNVNGTSSSIISLSTASSVNTSAYLYWDNLNFDIQNNTVGGRVRIGTKDYPNVLIISSSGTDHVQFNSGNTSFFIGNGATAGGGTTDDASFNWSLAGVVKLCRNSTIVAEIDSSNNLIMKTSGAIKVPEGTTAQRPASPQEGMIRKNSTLGVIEGYSAGEWFSLQGGLLNVQVFTSTGATTYTPTPGTRRIIVELVGGGGGGAYRPSTSAGQVVVPSPGNNADGIIVKYNSTITAGQTGTVNVGFGGYAQGTPGGNGNNGQQSSFSIGGNSVIVGGGLGGTYASATSTFPVVKMSSGFTGSPSITGFTLLKNASSGVSSIGVYSPISFAPHLINSPKSAVDTTCGVGDMSFSSENSSASVGGVGTSGKVIIYEYS